MNVLFASSEVAPFAKTGGLADVAGSLPKALHDISCNVSVILPFYRCVEALNLKLEPFKIGEFEFFLHERDGIEYIFLSNDKYYDRDNLYSQPHGDYEDNYLRFSYFSAAIVALALVGKQKPDIINCNDWQTGLVPIYLKLKKSNIKTLFTIHNIGYQGLFNKNVLNDIKVPREFYKINGIEYYGKISFLKAGIVYSTAISTVSKKYSEEIMTKEFGCGMEGILKTRLPHIYGILNGVDYSDWDPSIDKYIKHKYNSNSIDKKEECKRDLIESLGFPKEALDRPLIGAITRLAEQKGIDLLVDAAEDIVNLGANIVILGTGDAKYNSLAKIMAERHPDNISSNIKFDNELAHKIEAGSDMFIMPSRYEPCGLNQLYSLRYGTLPIVRATGGLDDTINDLDSDKDTGDGIKFTGTTSEDVVSAVSRAISVYKDKTLWNKVQKRIMNLDFSWTQSATHYKELYEKLI